MMSQERNDEITLVGADQPAGKVLRQYWMPAALSDELEGNRPGSARHFCWVKIWCCFVMIAAHWV